MWDYLRGVWRCRYFWLSMVKIDLRTRYHGSALGVLWSLLHPLAKALILCVVFHHIFNTPVSYYGPYVVAGLAFWNFILGTTLEGCRCFILARSYIHQYPAPFAIYPLRTALSFGFHLLPALAIVILLATWRLGLSAPWALLGLVPGLTLVLVLGWSLALLAGLAHAHLRDTQHLLEMGFQVLFYLTPIIYPPGLRGENSTFQQVMQYNPLVPFLQLLREPVLDGRLPSAATFMTASLIVLATTALGAWLLSRLEKRLIYAL
jgi:lipopolysaccharide transport system permease protein